MSLIDPFVPSEDREEGGAIAARAVRSAFAVCPAGATISTVTGPLGDLSDLCSTQSTAATTQDDRERAGLPAAAYLLAAGAGRIGATR